jgi:hypothetical protein
MERERGEREEREREKKERESRSIMWFVVRHIISSGFLRKRLVSSRFRASAAIFITLH